MSRGLPWLPPGRYQRSRSRRARLDPDAPEIWEFLRNAGREAGRGELQTEVRRQFERLRSARR